MKRFAVFTLFLLNSAGPVTACGYYPFGEELRFSIFDPRAFGFSGYERFIFTSHAFAPVASDTVPGYIDEGKAMNIALWRKRSNVLFSDSVICEAVYSDRVSPDNAFVKYLYERKDVEALRYLNFARECTGLADALADPWERNSEALSNRRGGYIQVALDRADKCDEELGLRYAFQAIRMAFYNSDYGTVKTAYAKYFGRRDEKNILDYWALHFRTLAEPAGPEKNYYAAQVFAHAPDKRYAAYCCFDRSVPVTDVLRFAKTDHEKAAIWFLEGIRRYGRALECMRHINVLEPGSEWVDFLLAREVNKLEDRIYTPSYAYFTPAMEEEGMAWPWGISVEIATRRVQNDRAYAQQVLDFSRQVRQGNKAFRETCRGYLLFMTKQYPAALAELNIAAKICKDDPARSMQVLLIRSLCLVAVQDSGNTTIPEEVKPVLLQQHRSGGQRFILAIARELEFSGNTTDAALLLMKLNPDQQNWDKMLYWGTEEVHPFTYTYATEYFDYLDSKYTTTQLSALISNIRRAHATDTFSTWKYREAEKELPRLYDLLGTKYMRLNRLEKALVAFEEVNDTLWSSKHQPFNTYLNANPFYANMYSGHEETVADTVAYDKEGITRTLIGYLAKAEDTTNIHRHYYYFLAANCYFNMTQYGNSWMMKRYYWSINSVRSGMPDSKDYFDCDKAKMYYEKARVLSKSKKFAALCLRMAARCEGYRLRHEAALKEDEYFSAGKYVNVEPKKNTYYRKLEKKYPDYYDDLISNCYSFDEYFKTWK